MTEPERYEKVISLIRTTAKNILPEGSTVTLFGSRARGDARPNSDWDIHIQVPGPEKISLSKKAEYELAFNDAGFEIGEEINAIAYTYDGWKKNWFMPLYINIRDEGIRL